MIKVYMITNRFQKTVGIYLILLLIYWVFLQQSDLTTSIYNFLYSFLFSLIPLLGGFAAMVKANVWGRLKSNVGTAVFFIGLGLFSWGAGSMVWSYYNIFSNIVAPYPSYADLGFLLSIPFWAIGVIYLSRATGAKFGMKKNKGKAILVLVPPMIVAASYYLLVVVARGGVITEAFDNNLKLFLDIAYPSGDAIILTLSLVILGLSFNYLGGQYKLSILSILFGFGFMYLADFIFSYTTALGTFYNGNWGDLFFTIALFLITFGILGFCTRPKSF
jgi:hypothetical protein